MLTKRLKLYLEGKYYREMKEAYPTRSDEWIFKQIDKVLKK